MKLSKIEKSMDSQAITREQMDQINRYTRRGLERDEVFVFSIVLCDNEIDRDYERFTVDALEKLGALFVGKTGVFDHSPKAENQSARIFETRLVREDATTSLGEVYCCLKAWAYMARCEKNADLILEIDAGIKKEVSVGCAVERIVCSVCGADQNAGGCVHKKGKSYDHMTCHYLLEDPTDAYEWSFVAVPAQKNAGVVKKFDAARQEGGEQMELAKLFEATQDTTLTKAQLRELSAEYAQLKLLAAAGERYHESLRCEVTKLALLSQPELAPGVMEAVAAKMDISELLAFRKSFLGTAGAHYPVTTQLGGCMEARGTQGESEFKI